MKKLPIIFALFLVVGCATGSLPTKEQLANEHFTECPSNYQELIKNQLSRGLYDPYSAVFTFSAPQKFVYKGNFGYRIIAGLNAKNRFGGYVGVEDHMFFCFPDGSVREINEAAMGAMHGLKEYH